MNQFEILKAIWKGRNHESNEPLYWYEKIRINPGLKSKFEENDQVALIGYCSDEGASRNQGRPGSSQAPDHIRTNLAKLVAHFRGNVVDLGNLFCFNNDLIRLQDEFHSIVKHCQKNQIFTIGLGGSHDIAFAHFMGLSRAFLNKKIGIINLDAHLDLREPNPHPNSGTPFWQSLNSNHLNDIKYLAIGIRQCATSKDLLSVAKSSNTQIIFLEDCLLSKLPHIDDTVTSFISSVDVLYLSLDMDCFSSAYAPGVSAAFPVGLNPTFVIQLLKRIKTSPKLKAMDVAEVNPVFDIDHRTSKLAAFFIDYIVQSKVN